MEGFERESHHNGLVIQKNVYAGCIISEGTDILAEWGAGKKIYC